MMSALTNGHRQVCKLRMRQSRSLIQLGRLDEAQQGTMKTYTVQLEGCCVIGSANNEVHSFSLKHQEYCCKTRSSL